MHAVDRYLLVAQALGASAVSPHFQFRANPADEEAVASLLARVGLGPLSRWIAMNVSARWMTKRWPAEHFARVADRLQQSGLAQVVLLGGEAERPDSEAVRRLMQTKAVDLTGQTPVGLLPGLLRRAALLITNDSGPMHIAAAVATPVVALFGPTDPARTGPYGLGHLVLSHAVACRPCFSRACKHAVPFECLNAVTPDQVEEAVRRQLLGRERASVS
jgi:lipopolysaccharide heptosyltransferase II